MSVQETKDDVEKVLGDLDTLGQTLRASSQIYRAGLADLHDALDKARGITDTVQGDLKDAAAIHADATNEGKPNGATPPKGDTSSPFEFGASR